MADSEKEAAERKAAEELEEMRTLRHVLDVHSYDYKITKEGDPGWHGCRCLNWEGYWSGFNEHVAREAIAEGFKLVPARSHYDLITARNNQGNTKS